MPLQSLGQENSRILLPVFWFDCKDIGHRGIIALHTYAGFSRADSESKEFPCRCLNTVALNVTQNLNCSSDLIPLRSARTVGQSNWKNWSAVLQSVPGAQPVCRWLAAVHLLQQGLADLVAVGFLPDYVFIAPDFAQQPFPVLRSWKSGCLRSGSRWCFSPAD